MFIGRAYEGRPARSWPSSVIEPEVGVSKPASMRSSVVLPQPDEPSRAKISPLTMSIETLSTAGWPSKSLTMFLICRKASALIGQARRAAQGGGQTDDCPHLGPAATRRAGAAAAARRGEAESGDGLQHHRRRAED